MNFTDVKIPATWEESFEALDEFLKEYPSELEYIDSSKSSDDMIVYHNGLGRMMRNHWSLWGDSELKKNLSEIGFTHADDMSGFILESYWNYRHSIPNDDEWVNSNVEKYRKYWASTTEQDAINMMMIVDDF